MTVDLRRYNGTMVDLQWWLTGLVINPCQSWHFSYIPLTVIRLRFRHPWCKPLRCWKKVFIRLGYCLGPQLSGDIRTAFYSFFEWTQTANNMSKVHFRHDMQWAIVHAMHLILFKTAGKKDAHAFGQRILYSKSKQRGYDSYCCTNLSSFTPV